MKDEVLPGTSLLTLVRTRGEAESPRDEVAIDVGVVRGDDRQQLVDQLLMTLLSFYDCHVAIVRRGFELPPAAARCRSRPLDGESETSMAWLRRRQERKAAMRAARMLLALGQLSSAGIASERAPQASLGALR
jgi:hypothetical protein